MTVDVVHLPDEEAVAHFRSKGRVFGFDWRDVSADEHLVAFTAAKAMRVDVLDALRAEVDRAISEGATLREFQASLEPRLRRLGWWGVGEETDPLTGEKRRVQLGSPRRLRIIFDTNVRMAAARGRWERIDQLKARMPYLRYVSVLDSRTRPEHRAWHGTVLPVDHPFWATHYPPNGWRCRCAVQQLSEGDLRRRGREVSAPPRVRTRDWTNERTGETVAVPEGIDPGFQHNVGRIDRAAAARRLLEGKIDASPPDIRRAARPLLDEAP